MSRYVVGFLLAVGLIILVVVLIVRSLVSGPATSVPGQVNLTDYAGTTTSVQLTLDSPVVAPATHHDIIINVGNYQSTITVTEGYEGAVVRTQSYPMSTSAYAVFLRALKLNGFSQGNNDPAAKDERGQCALGERFIYQVIDGNGNDLQRYWYTSCGTGTFGGSAAVIRRLFVSQIPDYYKLTNDIDLSVSVF